MTGRPKRKPEDPAYWIPACTEYACTAGQWASDEEISRGLEDLGRFLTEVEERGAEGSAGFAASYLAHRIARAHLVRAGSSIDDARDSLNYRSRDAEGVFRAAWPWDFPHAKEMGTALLRSLAWRKCEPDFSPTGGLGGGSKPS